jgi:hypothetical protein
MFYRIKSKRLEILLIPLLVLAGLACAFLQNQVDTLLSRQATGTLISPTTLSNQTSSVDRSLLTGGNLQLKFAHQTCLR